MRYWPTLLLVAAVIAAPFIWHLTAPFFEDQAAKDAERAEFEALGQRVVELEQALEGLSAQVDGLDARTARALTSGQRQETARVADPARSGDDTLKDAFAQVVLIGSRREFNQGLTYASPTFLKEFLGLPREELSDNCEEMTNPELKSLLSTETVGPIKARLLKPALISLRQVFANVQVYEPELYKRIHSAGSLCVRSIRGAPGRASTHAYGLAVDINIDGVLDTLGDGKTQLGLMILSEFFRKEGWAWGAAFSREDSMHFEVSREKLEQWRRLGQI